MNVGFVNLSSFVLPEIKEETGKFKFVKFGENNDYFQVLIDRYVGSPTNHAIINSISQQIYGKGLNATDANKKPEEYAMMIRMFSKECVRRLCTDLKMLGQCSAQIIYSKNRTKIVKVEHLPVETLRAEKADENGKIPAYYYHKNWADLKQGEQPRRIPAFGMSQEPIEIFYIKPYKPSFFYYSPPDYQGCVQYCMLEEEISNYLINYVQQGLSPSMLLNFNNGIPNQEERELIESRIAQKFTGSNNAGKFVLSFNDSKETAADLISVPVNDAHLQFQTLSDEASKKIMVGHRVTSPMLMGIKDQSGLGNNADEIKTASLLFDNVVIRTFQELLISSFDQILAFNDITLNLYFTTLQPLEFTEVDPTIQDSEEIEEKTGVEVDENKSETPVEEDVTDEEIEKVDASYNGAQISSAIAIIEKVKEGILTNEQAKTFLIQFLQLPESVANSFFDEENVNLSRVRAFLESKREKTSVENLKKIDGQTVYETKEEAEEVAKTIGCKGSHIHEEDGKEWHMPCESHEDLIRGIDRDSDDLQEFIDLGEDEEALLENYDLIDVSEVDYEAEEAFDEKIKELNDKHKPTNLVKTGDAYGRNRKSEQDGTSKQDESLRFLVRYQYAPLKKQKDTRKFCNAMVNAKKIYRKEDILKMSDKRVNPGFGVKGAATYSIWLYKGGARCFHKWFRKTYVINEDRNINKKPLRKTDEITSTKAKSMGFKAPINDQLVPVAPRDMKFEGYTKAYWDKMGFKNTAK